MDLKSPGWWGRRGFDAVGYRINYILWKRMEIEGREAIFEGGE
jgi:hypothetical protein